MITEMNRSQGPAKRKELWPVSSKKEGDLSKVREGGKKKRIDMPHATQRGHNAGKSTYACRGRQARAGPQGGGKKSPLKSQRKGGGDLFRLITMGTSDEIPSPKGRFISLRKGDFHYASSGKRKLQPKMNKDAKEGEEPHLSSKQQQHAFSDPAWRREGRWFADDAIGEEREEVPILMNRPGE